MTPLAALFEGERIKWRRSWATVAAVLPPLCQLGFLFLIFWFSEIQADQLGPGFQVWYQVNHAAWNLIFMPVTVALVALLSWDQEEEAGAWKHLLLQPVPRHAHYLAKLLSHTALLLVSQVLFTGGLLLTGILLKRHATYLTMGPVRLDLALRLGGFSFLAALPLLGLHTWLSTRLRGVGLALGITLAGSLLTVLLLTKVAFARWLPWGLAVFGVPFGANGIGQGWSFLLGSLLGALLLGGLGALDFARRDEPR
jgi:hypothetical protein